MGPLEGTAEGLWERSTPGRERFGPSMLKDVPDIHSRYLEHSILPGTPVAGAVRLHMSGSIKLGNWCGFRGTEVLTAAGQMVWEARTRKLGLPVSGYDRLIDCEGSMRWKMLGLLRVVDSSGDDVTRSAAGRAAAEMIWLPSAFLRDDVVVQGSTGDVLQASFGFCGRTQSVSVRMDDSGRPLSVLMKRWGNPGGEWGPFDFGALIEEEDTFGGYTIPSRLRAGWFFDGERFGNEGEFFRVVIEEAEFR